MIIKKLDLLSSSPQMNFQSQKTNKTFFGGILFIIYIIIMIIISIFYILNYVLNDKYTIRYSIYKNFSSNEEEYNKNEDLNPHLNFSIDIKKISQNFEEEDATNQFQVIDNNFNTLETNIIISSTPSDFSFSIMALGGENDYNEISNETYFACCINLSYSGYKIDHQNSDTPLERNNDKYTFYQQFYFL